MGVDYDPLLVVGKVFDRESDALKFLNSHNVLSEEDHETIKKEGLIEFLYSHESLPTGGYINSYVGDSVYIGYQVETESVEALVKSVTISKESWKTLFGENASIVNEVQVW